MVGLKKKNRSHTQKSHPKVVNPRDIAGERKKKKKKKKKAIAPHVFLCMYTCAQRYAYPKGWREREEEEDRRVIK